MKTKTKTSTYKPFNYVEFDCSGRTARTNDSVIGIGEDLTVYHGYDAHFMVDHKVGYEEKLVMPSPEEAISLSDYMIGRWGAYKDNAIVKMKSMD
jgi:hypothetical protein